MQFRYLAIIAPFLVASVLAAPAPEPAVADVEVPLALTDELSENVQTASSIAHLVISLDFDVQCIPIGAACRPRDTCCNNGFCLTNKCVKGG